MSARVIVLAAAAFLAAGCGSLAAPSPAPPPATAAASSAAAPGYVLPDRALTPGAAGSDITQVCPHVNPALEAARPASTVKARIFAAYRIPLAQRRLYVIDHDISLSIDGENVPANLWPQPVAQARLKDRVEAALHKAVCSGKVTLRAAQQAEALDWATAEHALGLAP